MPEQNARLPGRSKGRMNFESCMVTKFSVHDHHAPDSEYTDARKLDHGDEVSGVLHLF